MDILQKYIDISEEVKDALETHAPILSLESSAITHGIPYPENIKTFNTMHHIARQNKVVPALIGIYNGKIKFGFTQKEIEYIVKEGDPHKINSGEIAWALSNQLYGGTTISATAFLSRLIGINFFVAGGIGGVHIGDHLDISADLKELATNPIMIVCSGAKAILSVTDTIEMLETLTVPVVGYQTNKLPGFIIRDTGIELRNVADNVDEVVNQYRIHQRLGRTTAFVVVVPPPEGKAIPAQEFDLALKKANQKAKEENVSGPKLTPFLLEHISDTFSGSMFSVIEALLIQNVELGCQIVNQYYM